MKLTGKCKEDFDKWYLKSEFVNDYYITYVPKNGMLDEYKIIKLEDMPQSMQYGVLEDFFYEELSNTEFLDIFVEFISDELKYSTCSLRDIRTEAIEKANQIYYETNPIH